MSNHARLSRTAVTLVLPLVLVKILFALLAGPKTGTASNTSTLPRVPVVVPTVDTKPESSEQQEMAAARIAVLRQMPIGESPLVSANDTSKPDTPVIKATPRVDDANVVVRMILVSSNGNVALINGARYEEGDVIEETSWKIIEIDGTARSVRCEHESSGDERQFFVDNRPRPSRGVRIP